MKIYINASKKEFYLEPVPQNVIFSAIPWIVLLYKLDQTSIFWNLSSLIHFLEYGTVRQETILGFYGIYIFEIVSHK